MVAKKIRIVKRRAANGYGWSTAKIYIDGVEMAGVHGLKTELEAGEPLEKVTFSIRGDVEIVFEDAAE